MGRIIQQKGEKGSLKWIQYILNDHPDILYNSINKFLPDSYSQPIEWLSPLADDDYAEYRDQTFLDLLGIKLAKKELKDFWVTDNQEIMEYYEIVWAEFERRFGTLKHTKDTKVKSDK